MKTRFISIVLMITLATALFTACGSRVEYHNMADPSTCIGADVTTFGKEITVKLTADGGVVFQ